MKLESKAEVKVLALQEGEYNNKPTYKVTIQQGVEAGTVSCSRDVFNAVQPGKDYIVVVLYNDQYKTSQFTGVVSEVSAAPDMAAQQTQKPMQQAQDNKQVSK